MSKMRRERSYNVQTESHLVNVKTDAKLSSSSILQFCINPRKRPLATKNRNHFDNFNAQTIFDQASDRVIPRFMYATSLVSVAFRRCQALRLDAFNAQLSSYDSRVTRV